MLADANKIRQNLTPTVSETPFHMGASFGLKKKDESQTENMPSHSESEPKNKPDREKQEKNNDSSSLEEFDDTFEDPEPRLPRAVQAAYLGPLRRKVTYGIPVCDLQLRSYSVRNLEFMADVALRAAYFLDLPAMAQLLYRESSSAGPSPRRTLFIKRFSKTMNVRLFVDLYKSRMATPKLYVFG
ncbi:Mitochondrial ribosomal [Blumeria graminis f. sp. tritici 96224]|nr:Mitochondrial ribosomal [Blumeria graminis f. sp. tritici 96224]